MRLSGQLRSAEAYAALNRTCLLRKISNRLLRQVFMPPVGEENRRRSRWQLRIRKSATCCGWEKGTDPFHGAPVVLIVLGDKNHPTYLYDGSLVIGNMMLAAHSLGLGSVWIHRAKEEFRMHEYKFLLERLGIEGNWEGIGHCAVGYIDGDIPSSAPRKKNRVYWVD